MTSLPWETIAGVNALNNIAPGIIWTHKPLHHVKVAIQGGGFFFSVHRNKIVFVSGRTNHVDHTAVGAAEKKMLLRSAFLLSNYELQNRNDLK